MPTTADIDILHAHLDAEPGDSTARLVLADMLQEAGSPLAGGYRALGLLGLNPESMSLPRLGRHWWWSALAGDEGFHAHLPADWFGKLRRGGWAFWPVKVRANTRRAVEDAAARAFARLPAARRAELLAAGGAEPCS